MRGQSCAFGFSLPQHKLDTDVMFHALPASLAFCTLSPPFDALGCHDARRRHVTERTSICSGDRSKEIVAHVPFKLVPERIAMTLVPAMSSGFRTLSGQCGPIHWTAAVRSLVHRTHHWRVFCTLS